MAKKISTASRIRNYISANPEAKAEDVAIKFNTTKQNVYVIRHILALTLTSRMTQ